MNGVDRILRMLYIEGKTKATKKLPEGSEDSRPESRLDYCRPPGTQHARRSNKKGPRPRQWGPGISRGWRGSIIQSPFRVVLKSNFLRFLSKYAILIEFFDKK